MIGEYTETTITAPSSAQAGSAVDIVVSVENLHGATIYVIPVLSVNGSPVAEGSYEHIIPEGTQSWTFSLVMPSENAVLVVDSWCEDDFEWHLDSSAEHIISVTTAGAIDLGTMVSMMIIVMMMSMIMGTMSED